MVYTFVFLCVIVSNPKKQKNKIQIKVYGQNKQSLNKVPLPLSKAAQLISAIGSNPTEEIPPQNGAKWLPPL